MKEVELASRIILVQYMRIWSAACVTPGVY